MPTVKIPANDWRPRSYQMPLWRYLMNGGRRAVAAWHRRAGKDDVFLHWMAVAAMRRKGSYWTCLPSYSQARKALWSQVDPHVGKRRVDIAFPHEIRRRTLDQEMMIEFVNGSTWQLIGSDEFDRLVGTSPAGIVFSEFALAMPAAWSYLAPILIENDGWAAFISTFRGKNHFYKMLQTGMQDLDWFAEIKSVVDTGFSLERVEEQRKQYQNIYGEEAGDALIEQEYFCSPEAAILGSIYGKEISNLRRLGRVKSFLINPAFPVHRSWDLGISKSDSTAIWFFQWIGDEVLYVDFIEGFQQPIDWYADKIRAKGYPKGTKDNPAFDFVPHDARVKSLQTGMTRVEFMIKAGLNPRLVPDHYVEDRLSAGRYVLKRAFFHPRCADALEVLSAYAYEYDDKIMTFKKTVRHDYSSHTSDSFGYSAIAYREPDMRMPPSGKGRALLINAPETGIIEPDRPQVTIDDLWEQHKRQLNQAKRIRGR